MDINTIGKKGENATMAKPRVRVGCHNLRRTLRGETAQAALEAPLFTTAAGQRITHKVVTRIVRRTGQQIDRHLHPRMFRHSYATELLERGADIRTFADLLGHESVATTEIYTHVSAARQRRVVELLEKPVVRRSGAKPSATNGPGDKKCLCSPSRKRRKRVVHVAVN